MKPFSAILVFPRKKLFVLLVVAAPDGEKRLHAGCPPPPISRHNPAYLAAWTPKTACPGGTTAPVSLEPFFS